jgi:putative MATE family efflux protein
MEKSKLNEFLKNPKKSLIIVSIPVIVASIVETLYTIVDGIFVGRISAEALAALTFAWPFFFILVALSLGINAGMSSKIARFIGQKNKKQAENAAMHGLLIALFVSIILIIIGLPLLKLLFSISGAEGNVLKLGVTYMFYILLGVIFMFLSYATNSIFSAQGDTRTAMKIDIYSLVLNIILCPIFIFVFRWGVMGAALATSVSVLFAFLQSLYYLKKKSYLKIHISSFKYSPSILKEIISVGFPSTLMMLVISFYMIFLNRAMAHFSFDHVAAFGTAGRLESLATLPIYGLSVGALTLVGMFYGAKRFKQLKETSWHAVKITVLVTSVIGLILFIFPEMFMRIFTSDIEVIKLGAAYIRLDVFTFPAMGITMVVSRIMQGMGLGLPGLVINLARVFGVAIPLAYIFVFILGWGYLSIAVAMILGGIAASAIGITWLKIRIKKLTK